MLDPRMAIMDMIHDVREKLNAIEMNLWEIPHQQQRILLDRYAKFTGHA